MTYVYCAVYVLNMRLFYPVFFMVELECGTADKLLLLACENGAACTIDVASRKQVQYILP